ncbi:Embryo-specific protein ATS3B [Linum grandiflorum]
MNRETLSHVCHFSFPLHHHTLQSPFFRQLYTLSLSPSMETKMAAAPSSLLLMILSIVVFFVSFCSANDSVLTLQPHALDSFNLTLIQEVANSCSYTVDISTSCSSSVYTRDQISIAFGDAYGNQIYAPRIDDPATRTFERCSSDTFQINGPCAYQICYVYLYRSGPDGWKPGSVRIYGYNSRAATFNYNTFIPGDLWYGFNYCGNAGSGSSKRVPGWFVSVILFVLASSML